MSKYRSSESEAKRFIMLASEADQWLTLEQWVKLLTVAGYWSLEFHQATPFEREEHAKRMLRQLTDNRLWPLFAEYVWDDDEGQPVRYWKPQAKLNAEDYELLINMHLGLPGPAHKKRAKGFLERAVHQGIRLPEYVLENLKKRGISLVRGR